MTGRELMDRLEAAVDIDAEVCVNTTLGEVRIFDVITHYRGEITIECVNPYTGNTMEVK